MKLIAGQIADAVLEGRQGQQDAPVEEAIEAEAAEEAAEEVAAEAASEEA